MPAGGQHEMARPYSQDLRDPVIGSVASGRTCRATAAMFGVSVASVVKWSQPAAQNRSAHHRGHLARHRHTPRPLQTRGMRQLPRQRRLCFSLTGSCSSPAEADERLTGGRKIFNFRSGWRPSSGAIRGTRQMRSAALSGLNACSCAGLCIALNEPKDLAASTALPYGTTAR